MIERFGNVFKVPELRRRVLFTFGMLMVYRIGGAIPTPGIDTEALAQVFSQRGRDVFAIYDLFAGGYFKQATIFALGIMPHISASIIFQLLGSVFPPLHKLQQEGPEGQRKINQWSRYLTVALAAVQSIGVGGFLLQQSVNLVDSSFMFMAVVMITMTTGCIFIMWMGEQITEHGVGNGISLLIFIGIVARLPHAIINQVRSIGQVDQGGLLPNLGLFALMVLTIAAVVFITMGVRKIPVQYAKRIVGRKVYGGQSTHIPLRVNTSGVMPIIFAQAIMLVPTTIVGFLPVSEGAEPGFIDWLASALEPTTFTYWIPYGLMIIFFSYFYTAIVFNPMDLARNMRQHGGFIPGVRPGARTAAHIDNILTKITLPGSVFLALIAAFPVIVITMFQLVFNTTVDPAFSDFFGGTGLLIVVGVALDTLEKVETQLLTRHYDGFLKRGKVRGRRG